MIQETPFGFEIQSENLILLFGNAQANLTSLKANYTAYDFVRLKQIHSDAVVESRDSGLDYQVLADAHWSFKENLALCVITADCVPVFIFDPQSKFIAGIHAGWRGVASQIIPKTIKALKDKGSRPEDLKVFIGPHIQLENFEVGSDVRDLLLTSLGPLDSEKKAALFKISPEPNKFFMNLNNIVLEQLSQSEIESKNIVNIQTDTFSDTRFHSHRRDKEKAGRQISFICQKRV